MSLIEMMRRWMAGDRAQCDKTEMRCRMAELRVWVTQYWGEGTTSKGQGQDNLLVAIGHHHGQCGNQCAGVDTGDTIGHHHGWWGHQYAGADTGDTIGHHHGQCGHQYVGADRWDTWVMGREGKPGKCVSIDVA